MSVEVSRAAADALAPREHAGEPIAGPGKEVEIVNLPILSSF